MWSAYAWPTRSLRVNFVTSLDGHITGESGLSAPLSSPEDRRIFHMLRAGCDAILVGAGTVRSEKYNPVNLKPQWRQFRERDGDPELLIASESGDVPEIAGSRVVRGRELAGLLEDYPRILCEGGPHLFGSLLQQDLVDEIALSVSGHVGGEGNLLPDGVSSHAVPKHAHLADDTVFTLWDVR